MSNFNESLQNLIVAATALLESCGTSDLPEAEVNEEKIESMGVRPSDLKLALNFLDVESLSIGKVKQILTALGESTKGKSEDLYANLIALQDAQDTAGYALSMRIKSVNALVSAIENETDLNDIAEKSLGYWGTGEVTGKVTSEEEPNDEQVEASAVDEPEVDNILEYVRGLSDEEIKSKLKKLGIAIRGNRQVIETKLIDAIQKGLVDAGEPDTVTDGETKEEAKPLSKATKAVDFKYEPMEEVAHSLYSGSTKVRKDAIESLVKDTAALSMVKVNEYVHGNLNQADLAEYATLVEEDKRSVYVDLKSLWIDNDGVTQPKSEAYVIGKQYFCCAKELSKDGKDFKCLVCNTEYKDS